MSDQFNAIAPELQQASRFYGTYSHVARKLGVTPQHVRQVAKGLRISKKVSAELRREIQRRKSREGRNAA